MTETNATPGSVNQQVVNPNPSDAKTLSKVDAEKMVEKAVREATGKMGQKHKLEKDTLTDRVKTLTGENASLKGTVENQKAEVDTVNKTLDDLSADDPDKKNIAKLIRDLTSAKKSIQSEKRENAAANATEKADIETSRATLDTDRREVFISKIAAEHKDGKADTLAEICDTFGIGADEEKIRSAAGTKWELLSADQVAPVNTDVPIDSNNSSGGDHLNDADYLTAYGNGQVHDHAKADKILQNMS